MLLELELTDKLDFKIASTELAVKKFDTDDFVEFIFKIGSMND